MAYLASLFFGWNLTVLIVFIVLYGLGGLAKKFSFVEFLMIFFLKSIGVLLIVVLSPLTYFLIDGHKEEYGSYFGYIWGASKIFILGEDENQ